MTYQNYDITAVTFPIKVPSTSTSGCYFKLKINNTLNTKQFICSGCSNANQNDTYSITAGQTDLTVQVHNANLNSPSLYLVNGPSSSTTYSKF